MGATVAIVVGGVYIGCMALYIWFIKNKYIAYLTDPSEDSRYPLMDPYDHKWPTPTYL